MLVGFFFLKNNAFIYVFELPFLWIYKLYYIFSQHTHTECYPQKIIFLIILFADTQ